MKYTFFIISIILLATPSTFAQKDIEKKLQTEFWEQAPAAYKVTEVPEKWKNESAVFLGYSTEYSVDLNGKLSGPTHTEKFKVHYRIKLLDKAAVQEYSELSFNSKTVKTNMFGKPRAFLVYGVKVVKADGTEKIVDLKEAVKADDGSSNDLKIPIPNLETGDIIDYFIAVQDESVGMPKHGGEDLFAGKYPIVYQKISFTVPDKVKFYHYIYNADNKFVTTVSNDKRTYTLIDEMREKYSAIQWDAPYLNAPHYRYKITDNMGYANAKKDAENFMNVISYNPSNVGYIFDFFNENFKKEKDQKKIVHELYYLLRNPIYKEAYYGIKQGDPLQNGYTPNEFFLIAEKYLTKNKISSELMLAPVRLMGPFEEQVNLSSTEFVMKVNTTPPIYLPRPYPFTLPNEVSYALEGAEAISRPIRKDNIFPVSTKDQNSTTIKFKIDFNGDDKTKLDVARSVSASGHNKDYHQYLVVTDYDYLKEYDQQKYQIAKSSLFRGLIKDYNKEKTKFEQRKVQDYNEREKRIKAAIEEETEIKIAEYKKLELKSIGMWESSPNTEYEDELTIESLSKKAGPNFIVDIGKLIAQQTQIKEEERVRTQDIYMPYARAFINEMTITIPEGYSIEGLENFNKKVITDIGGFESSATSDGKVVTIIAKKYYNSNYYPVGEWTNLLSFLDAAVEFYNAKLLLKKNG